MSYQVSRKVLRNVCLCFLALFYAGLITNGTFNFWGSEGFWPAYNVYLLQILQGDFSVPMSAIGKEGWYKDGVAYMSYGAIPALLRAPLLFFVDLLNTPVSRLIVWFLITSSTLLVQILLNRFWREVEKRSLKHTLLFGLLSLIVWGNSGYFLIVQNAPIFHEPYAASLLFFTVAFFSISRCYFFADISRIRCAGWVAACAVLCLHSRPTLAVGLYFATAVILLDYLVAELVNVQQKRYSLHLKTSGRVILQSWAPVLILLFGIFSYLWLNYIRFGAVFFNNDVEMYGHFIAGEGYSGRLLSMKEHGAFNLQRILPNGIFYLFGGWSLHENSITELGLGVVRKEAPFVKLSVLWAIPLLVSVASLLGLLIKALKTREHLYVMGLVFTVCFMAGAVLQLSYATITYRYMSEFWPPIMCLCLWGSFAYVRQDAMLKTLKVWVLALAIIGCLVSVFYSFQFYPSYSLAWDTVVPADTIWDD